MFFDSFYTNSFIKTFFSTQSLVKAENINTMIVNKTKQIQATKKTK